MQIFIESIDKEIWDAIVNGPYTPTCIVENKQLDNPFEWMHWWRKKKSSIWLQC